jgi:hypothetical protein
MVPSNVWLNKVISKRYLTVGLLFLPYRGLLQNQRTKIIFASKYFDWEEFAITRAFTAPTFFMLLITGFSDEVS